MTTTYTCECCDFTESFADEEAAFREGWDTPSHFPTGPVSCNLCPSSFVFLGERDKHVPIHEQWRRDGRPSEFSQETCLRAEDRVDQAKIEQVMQILGELDLTDGADILDAMMRRLIDLKTVREARDPS